MQDSTYYAFIASNARQDRMVYRPTHRRLVGAKQYRRWRDGWPDLPSLVVGSESAEPKHRDGIGKHADQPDPAEVRTYPVNVCLGKHCVGREHFAPHRAWNSPFHRQ